MIKYVLNYAKLNHGANASIKSKARELRKLLTEPEKILWRYIRGRKLEGWYFRRQHPYGIYILDFFCFEANLAIELDGKVHLSRYEYDNERTRYLKSSGLNVIRFKNSDVDRRIEWVLTKIKENLTDSQSLSKIIISPLGETGKGVKRKREIGKVNRKGGISFEKTK